MVWACIAKNFKSKLIKINENLNAKDYQKMLTENEIFEKLNKRFVLKDYIFQQDGTNSHITNSTNS